MGNYVDNNLIKDEKVVFETTLHWAIFISLRAIFTLFILPIIQMNTQEFAITNKRVIIKVGLISRRTLEMNIDKIETVNVNQSIGGRIFGFGTITVVGTGGTREVFRCIKEPLEFRKEFQKLS